MDDNQFEMIQNQIGLLQLGQEFQVVFMADLTVAMVSPWWKRRRLILKAVNRYAEQAEGFALIVEAFTPDV
jgi:hypothetical protein